MLQQLLHPAVHLAAEPDPARMAVVDEDRGAVELRVVGLGDAADIVAVAEDQEREDADGGVLQGMDAAHEVQPLLFDLMLQGRRDLDPDALGLEDRSAAASAPRWRSISGPGPVSSERR